MECPTSNPSILLIPEGGLYLAFRLPMILRRAGWEVDVLCLRDDPVGSSRYVRQVHRVATEEELYQQVRVRLLEGRRQWAAVIVTPEKLVRRLIAEGSPDLLRNWQPGSTRPGVAPFFLSKAGLAPASRHNQLQIPPSSMCSSHEDLVRFGDQAGWPIMLKPLESTGGAGVIKLASAADLPRHTSYPVLAQKFIQGNRGVVDLLASRGTPLAWLSSFSICYRHGPFSPSTARSFRAMPQLRPLVEAVAAYTEFEGFCGFDWIEEHQTGRIFLIEFHPRPSSGFRFWRFCGVNFPSAVRAWLAPGSEVFSPCVQAPGPPVEAHYFSADLFRCLRQRDWRGLRHWMPGSRSRHDVFLDDPPLLAAWFVQRCKRRLRVFV